MTPIRYEVVGEEEYALKIHVDETGAFTVDSGTYTTYPPRRGVLTDTQQQDIIDAIKALGIPRAHPIPDDCAAFEAHLTVGAPGHEAHYVFWEGALEEDVPLNRLIRELERI